MLLHVICVLYFLLPVALLGHLQCSLAWPAMLSRNQPAMCCTHPTAPSSHIAVDWQMLLRVMGFGLLQTAILAVCLLHLRCCQPSSTAACRRPWPCHAAAHQQVCCSRSSQCSTTRNEPSGNVCQVTTCLQWSGANLTVCCSLDFCKTRAGRA